jgi:hypothetical protein
VNEQERRSIADRAGRRCEYCRCPADFSSDDFSVEHIIPRARRGTDDTTNLAWACQGCNSRKFTAMRAPDPVTGRRVALYHPRQQRWTDHFAWSDDTLNMIGRTPTGRATIARLHLNRSNVVNLRRALTAIAEHPPADTL